MARQLPAHLSHKSALALLTPSSITAPIEAVRRVHDSHFARWPPHINLLYPFLSSPSEQTAQGEEPTPRLKQDIHARVEKAIKHIQPFHVCLSADPPGTFSHSRKSKTVWLGPTGHHVQQLQAALQAEFSECDADRRPFTPHLSIGQAQSQSSAESLCGEIKKSICEHVPADGPDRPVALDWYVDKVFIIERKGYKDRFKIIGHVELGKK